MGCPAIELNTSSGCVLEGVSGRDENLNCWTGPGVALGSPAVWGGILRFTEGLNRAKMPRKGELPFSLTVELGHRSLASDMDLFQGSADAQAPGLE